MPNPIRRRPGRHGAPALVASILMGVAATASAELPKVPEGFEVRVVASVPAVQFPCQVATGPDGALFVAEDPMDQLGTYPQKDGRILLFRDGKEPVVFAEGFRAIFGMAWRDGALYVSHMPFLTVVRDRDGDGRADEKADVFKDLGPTSNPGLNDHIVSGIQFGMDGRMYISVGDKGIPKVTGPDGKSAQIIGGGILRCRPDGRDVEVYSNGTRNHLEPNLDDRDDLFTYDNTDDGDGWWTRVTHHVDSGYYGYPYDYHDQPGRFLNRLAEYGGGSPCGGLVYKEDAWPETYRGMAFWAEWGKGKVQGIRFRPKGASFEVGETVDFVLPGEVKNFRPIDLALSADGETMYLADWGMGGWGTGGEKVGRVYAIRYVGPRGATRPRGTDSDPIEAQIRALDHPAFHERMRAQGALIRAGEPAFWAASKALTYASRSPVARRHLLWTVFAIGLDAPGRADLASFAEGSIDQALDDPDPALRAQAARALGLRAGGGVAAKGLVRALADADPAVRLQAVIGLGRLGPTAPVEPIVGLLVDADPYVAFAARRAARRIGRWDAVIDLGLKSTDPRLRSATLAALERVYDAEAVKALARYSDTPEHPAAERATALRYLAATYFQPRPWEGNWWGTRPSQGAEIPPRDVAWEGADAISAAFRGALSDEDDGVRLAGVAGIRAIGDRAALPHLRSCYGAESAVPVRVAIVSALGALKDREGLPMLAGILRDPNAPEPVREASLAAMESIGGDLAATSLIDLLSRFEPADARQIRVMSALGRGKVAAAVGPIRARLASPTASVRVAAATSLGEIGRVEGVVDALRPLTGDPGVDVRKAAIGALAALKDRESIPILLKAADVEETRHEATMALAAFPDVRAVRVFLRGLTDRSPDLRKACVAALTPIRDQAAPIFEALSARRELPPSALGELSKVYTADEPIRDWLVLGPLPFEADPPQAPGEPVRADATVAGPGGKALSWRPTKAVDAHGQVDLVRDFGGGEDRSVYAAATIRADAPRAAKMVVGSDDTLTVWLNGRQVYQFKERRSYDPETARFDVQLAKGPNRVLIRCGDQGGNWAFSVGATAAADYAFLREPAPDAFNPDAFRDFALKAKGDPARGRALFADPKGLACARCHAAGGEGGNVGPDMTGIGARYPREELIRSILYPSARIFSGYEAVVVATADGRVVTGVLKSDAPDAITLQDADAKLVRIPRAEVESRSVAEVSIMPNGLIDGIKAEEFADLIAYLESLKEGGSPHGGR